MKLITVIDLGSSKIAAACASIDTNGNPAILALENLHSRGVEQGQIQDFHKAVGDIASIVVKLEGRVKRKIRNVLVTTRGADIEMRLSRSMVPLSKMPREITGKDVKASLELAGMIKLPLEKAIVQKIVRSFHIDGEKAGIRNPIGLYGMRLEAESFIAMASRSKIQNITKSVDHAGLLLDGIYLSGMTSAGAVLNSPEKEKGVLFLDVGDMLTEALIFKEAMLKNSVISTKGASEILGQTGRPDKTKLAALFDEIVNSLSAGENDFFSVVLTGGGALLDGIIEEAEHAFKRPARIGRAKNEKRTLNSQDAIIHTSTIGLIELIAKERRESAPRNFFANTTRKLTHIYETYF